jgi:hypothetical protein
MIEKPSRNVFVNNGARLRSKDQEAVVSRLLVKTWTGKVLIWGSEEN